MRIVSYNVLKLKDRKDNIQALMEGSSLEVLCMQETYHPVDYMRHNFFTGKGFNQLVHVPPKNRAGEGIGTLTHDSISSSSRQHILPDYLTKFRNVVYTTLHEGSENEIHLINIHAPWKYYMERFGYNHKLNWYSALYSLIDEIKKFSDRIIIVGDYNIFVDRIVPDAADKDIEEGKIGWRRFEHTLFDRLLRRGFVDAFRLKNPESEGFTWIDPEGTCGKETGKQRLDYALVSKSLEHLILECKPLMEYRERSDASDHVPLYLSLDV